MSIPNFKRIISFLLVTSIHSQKAGSDSMKERSDRASCSREPTPTNKSRPTHDPGKEGKRGKEESVSLTLRQRVLRDLETWWPWAVASRTKRGCN